MNTNLAISSNEELRKIDSERSYTAISNQVAFNVLLNPKLGQASRLWMYFRFLQSGFKDRTFIQKTYFEIAEAFGVSKSTARAWAYKLRDEGYLQIIEQKHDRKNNFPNKFSVCIPKGVLEIIQTSNNGLLPVSGSDNNSSSPKAQIAEPANDSGKRPEADSIFPKEHEDTSDVQPLKSPETLELFNAKSHQKLFSELKGIFELEEATKFVSMFLDAISIKKQNGIIAFLECNAFVAKEINSRRELVLTAFKSITGLACSEIRFESHHEGNKKTPQSPERAEKPVKEKATPAPKKPSNKAESKPQREVFPHTANRLEKRLEELDGMPLKPSQTERYTSEIIFAVEQGSLSKFGITHGLNIGLKLVRENQWTTPAGYPQGGTKKPVGALRILTAKNKVNN